ncbi:MAG TPA: preprotein translocase subunit SecY [Mycobacteriales bacterium]|nr:preprotein translocase subunit SecY [Mycobacteriales bacterium]
MLTAFGRAFRTPDLRKKLLFTLAILALFRFGSTLPAPGVDYHNVHECLQLQKNSSVLALINLFSGGALLQLTVFALGIMPYITSSIILQLLVVVIPRLERLKDQGQSGQNKITQYTRYLTVALAILQSTGIVALARSGRLLQCTDSAGNQIPLLHSTSVFRIVTLVIAMTAGTAVIMWFGELITDRGIGNGMSLLIFTSIAARFPSQGSAILQEKGATAFTIVLLIGVLIIVAIVFMEQGQRRIPVQYAKRMIGRRMYGGTSTYIPLKVNQAGVIPVIFSSSLLYLPQLLGQIWTSNAGFENFVTTYFNPNNPNYVYVITYALLTIFFTYFYVAITFNPVEVSDNMRKYGGFIPGIRPGRPTAEYLEYVLSRITLPGSLYLTAIAVLPILALHYLPGGSAAGANQAFPFGGTSILILVGVGLDTSKQIESQLMLRNYEGFLR